MGLITETQGRDFVKQVAAENGDLFLRRVILACFPHGDPFGRVRWSCVDMHRPTNGLAEAHSIDPTRFPLQFRCSLTVGKDDRIIAPRDLESGLDLLLS